MWDTWDRPMTSHRPVVATWARLSYFSMLPAEPAESRFFKMVKTNIQAHHHDRLAESSSNLPLNVSFINWEAQNDSLHFEFP